MVVLGSILLTILCWCIAIFIITFIIDRKDFNKGVCPCCGKKYKVKHHDKIWTVYICDKCYSVAVSSNRYLWYRYGKKLDRYK